MMMMTTMTMIAMRIFIFHDDNHDPDKNVPQDAKWSLVSVIALVTVWAAWFALVRLLDFRYKYDIIIIIIVTIIIITIINITVTMWALVRLLELIYKYYFMVIMIIKNSTFNKKKSDQGSSLCYGACSLCPDCPALYLCKVHMSASMTMIMTMTKSPRP